jgi:hypothetical protein
MLKQSDRRLHQRDCPRVNFRLSRRDHSNLQAATAYESSRSQPGWTIAQHDYIISANLR